MFGIIGSDITPDVVSKVEKFIPEPLFCRPHYTIFHPVFIRLWKELRHLVGVTYHNSVQIEVLKTLETFIRDTVSSKFTRSYALYNIEKIDTMIDRFFRGKYDYADDVSWWLSLELWRRYVC